MIQSVLLVTGILLVLGYLFWLVAKSHYQPAPPKLEYVSFELDQDRVPFPVGSTLTVFGVTITAVDGEACANEVKVSKDYNEQWRNLFAALLAAEISADVPFSSHYTVSYGFYITIRELKPFHIPAAPEGFFNNAIAVHETGTKDAV